MKRSQRIVIVNTTEPQRSGRGPDELRWSEPGDYALALQVMQDQGFDVREVTCPSLDQVRDRAAHVFLLRDWRYRPATLARFIARHPDARTLIDLRLNPPEVHFIQRASELHYWAGPQARTPIAVKYTSSVLRQVSHAFIGSALNRELLDELGEVSAGMRTRLHVTPWRFRRGRVTAAELGRTALDYGEFRLLFVGKCIFRKGLFRLWTALRETGIENFELTVLTNSIRGSEVFDHRGHRIVPNTIIKELLGDGRVTVLPWNQSPAEMIELYHRSHLYVCPSLSDNGPNTVVEAMVCGVPVVLSDMCGAVESVPVAYRRVARVPKWWRGEDHVADSELAGLLFEYYSTVFARREVLEYGEVLRQEYLKMDCLGRLYGQYLNTFSLAAAPPGQHTEEQPASPVAG